MSVGASPAVSLQLQRFEHTGEGVAYIFLVDVSQSLKPERFAQMRTALTDWVQEMRESDRAVVITFGKEVKLIQDFTRDKESLQSAIASLAATDTLTQLHLGLVRALEVGKRADLDLPRYRVIVILSDGQDDFPGGVTSQEVLDRVKEDRMPIYALGFAPTAATVKDKEALKALGVFARTSGGEYLDASGDQLEAEYALLRQRIRQVFVAHFLCSACIANGQVHWIQLTHTAGTRRLTDGVALRLLPNNIAASPASLLTPPASAVTGNSHWPYRMVGAVLACVFVGGLILLLMRKPQPVAEEVASTPLPVAPPVSLASVDVGLQVRLAEVGARRPAKVYVTRLIDQLVIGGSATECDVVITGDPDIAARQCVLVREYDKVFVSDVDARSRTLVNGVPIAGRHRLYEDDILLLGRTKLRFLCESGGEV
ncbi:MAG: VWA domain-containing protein [Deltaproteobacteria bacterium]|nr:VWA domain-containing protein [Deltaproteobacteria bacterium]